MIASTTVSALPCRMKLRSSGAWVQTRFLADLWTRPNPRVCSLQRSSTRMSCCCGEPRNANETPGQQAQLGQPAFNTWNAPITHQPGPHPPPGFPHASLHTPVGSLHGPPQPPQPAWVPNSAPTPASQWNAGSINSYTPLLDPNIVRPSPVHAQDFRASTVSPPLHPPSRPTTSDMGRTGPPQTIAQQTMDEGKMSVSIDFGKSGASSLA